MHEERSLRVLIVDDEAGMRQSLRRIMLAKGFEVEVAASGAEAIEIAGDYQPQVLLLDIRMPGLNGVETYRQLKQLCPDATAIFMTAYSSAHLTDEAMEEGAATVLSKPVNIDDVCDLVKKAPNERPVLIVDDDPGIRSSLERILVANGCKVILAHSCEEAMARFRQRPRSVVLLDMKLDDGSGLDLLQQIRAVNPAVVAVLMTGFTELQPDMDLGLSLGAASTLVKPFDVDSLVAAIACRS